MVRQPTPPGQVGVITITCEEIMSTRSQYLAFIQEAYQREQGRVEEEVARWRTQFSDSSLFGYSVTRFPLHIGVTAAYLSEQTGDAALARRAAELFLRYREFTMVYPEAAKNRRPEYTGLALPPLDCAFDPILFAPAVERIRPHISASETAQLAEIAADSLAPIWRFPEWGGHNRAMLRAASLALCARAFPGHPRAADWVQMSDELAEESWGRWSIEDAMMYQSHWLRAFIHYAEARGKTELADLIQPRMHIKSMVQLLSPLGILPNYGDSHWLMHSPWEWLALLEWGAHTYRDPAMKWAAGRIWEERSKAEGPNIYAALVLTVAHRWCDDSIQPAQPHDVPDALDDLVLKKLVFRTGWDHNATYACLNYRDEGDYGRVARDYLRTNLAVSAEKMHHGHSDEGSFAMLVHDGTLLLHESGYREAPPDGIYRADRYHNRLVWRPSAGLPGQDAWDLLNDNGHYRALRTDRLYQSRLLDADIRRVRITDETQQLTWDRSIAFFPSLPAWVVIDTALAQRTLPRSFNLLWWTTHILSQGADWFETWIDQIHEWQNAQNAHLRIIIPPVPGQNNRLTTRTERRDFHDEQLIASSWRGEHRLGRSVSFVSVLWPHAPGAQEFPTVEVIASQPAGRGLAVKLTWHGEERLLATLADLTAPYLQDDIRPRNTADQGLADYGSAASDAAFVYVRRSAALRQAGFLNGTRLAVEGKILHQAPTSAMFQEDRSDLPGVPARFRWQGTF